jgi:glycosyltransferase involved in cell wall biosynthesis
MRIRPNQNMQVLFVCSGNHNLTPAFITEQKDELEKKGVKVDIFQIKGRGTLGYLKNYSALTKAIRSRSYDLIHAHFGFSGLLANLQRKLPVVTTFHGCDLNNKKHRSFSKVAANLSQKVIVVSSNMAVYLPGKIEKEVIPCGVDMNLFVPMEKEEARRQLMKKKKFSFSPGKKYILFSSTFDREVKNPALAKEAIALLGEDYELIELNGFTRQEVVLLMNAVDATLMTSRTEGSPQFIKEAMACSRPIVTTNVGDVQEIINGAEGCFITAPVAEEVANKLKEAIQFETTNGRAVMGNRYNNEILAERVIQLYSNL